MMTTTVNAALTRYDETSSKNIRRSVWGLITLTCKEEENAVTYTSSDLWQELCGWLSVGMVRSFRCNRLTAYCTTTVFRGQLYKEKMSTDWQVLCRKAPKLPTVTHTRLAATYCSHYQEGHLETKKDRNIFCFTLPAVEMFRLIWYNTEFRMLWKVVLWRINEVRKITYGDGSRVKSHWLGDARFV